MAKEKQRKPNENQQTNKNHQHISNKTNFSRIIFVGTRFSCDFFYSILYGFEAFAILLRAKKKKNKKINENEREQKEHCLHPDYLLLSCIVYAQTHTKTQFFMLQKDELSCINISLEEITRTPKVTSKNSSLFRCMSLEQHDIEVGIHAMRSLQWANYTKAANEIIRQEKQKQKPKTRRIRRAFASI